MHSENRTQELPDRLGPYRLEYRLGRGGMGEVWRAWDERLERHVALKQIRADATPSQGRERLRREARAAARLNHPAIVHIYDLLEGGDGDWIVMELVEGRTIRRLLDEESALQPARAVQICREIAEGLAEAHQGGILHRDLKASNVIVTPSGHAKILDFGLAKEIPGRSAAEGSDLTASTPGLLLGTSFSMSPEQVLGHPLDERSDLFSLGSLFYEMLTGEVPFRAENDALSMARVVNGELAPLQESHPELPAEVCELVDWLLRKEPQHRPRSAAEVLAALESAAGATSPAAVPARHRPPFPGSDDSSAITHAEPLHPAERRGEGRPGSGERRTVTLACCSLVQLERPAEEAGSLDPEVLFEAVIAFENFGREICRELSGSLAAVLNRMLWLCFGYPQAHENDAERAVRAARDLQERFAALPVAATLRLAVRAGLHTGPAVAVTRPSMGQALQPGDTFDIAMAIQGQVSAGRIGVSAASRRLLGHRFATHPLPPVHVKDLDATVDVYELDPATESGKWKDGQLPPLVNREAEMQILLDRFRLACSGSGQAVLIAGEAGIGKSRLVRALADHLAGEPAVWLTAHGSAFAQNTPLAPIILLLSRTIFEPEGGGVRSGVDKLLQIEETLEGYGLPRQDYAPFLAALLSISTEGRYPPLVLSPEARRKRTRTAVLALLGAISERRPLVLVVEDLHWIDPSTLELLGLLLAEIPRLPLLLVATFRPEFSPPWRHQTSVTQLNLGGLSEAHTAQLIAQVSEGKRVADQVRREIVARTDGIPLFVEELTKAILEGDAVLQKPAGIPFTLSGSLLARLDRLGEAKAVAQLAAVIGRSFTLEQLEALSWIKGTALRVALGQLLEAEILYRRGPSSRVRYVFKHALIQDAAYQSLLASERQQLHRRLVQLLQAELPEVAEAEPEMMAYHCERGGLVSEAVEYLRAAGLRAMQRSALLEAVNDFDRALDLLLGLPSTRERMERELALRSLLTPVLGAIQGAAAPEFGVNAGRCTTLCRDLGDRARLLPALYSLWKYHLWRGDRQASIDRSEELALLAATPAQVHIGYTTRAHTSHHRGRLKEALALSEQALALYDPAMLPELEAFSLNSTLTLRAYQAWTLWLLGEPARAVREQDAIVSLADNQRSPFLLGSVLQCELILSCLAREPEPAEEAAEKLMSLSREQDFTYLFAVAQCAKGWAVCQRGDLAAGMPLIEGSFDLHAATGARLTLGYRTTYLVEVYLAAGRLEEGLAAAREALIRSENALDVSSNAELLRLEGEILRACGNTRAAEDSLHKALGIAREQGARAYELRTAASLARLLAEQGRANEALPSLSTVCRAYTDGFITRDLREARELLDRLSTF